MNSVASPTLEKTPNTPTQARVAVAVDPVQRYGFFVLQLYLFLLVSRAAEFLDPGQRLHLALITAAAAGFCTFLNLNLRNAFDTKIGLALAAFSGWAIAEIPFSSWRGGSFHGLMDSWLKSYLTYVIVVSLIASLDQLRKALSCVALGTALIVFLSFKFGMSAENDDRFSFEGGSLANSNDLAMELILGLPFVLFVATGKERNRWVRTAAWLVVPVLLFVVLKTGSRAGLLALVAMGVLLFFKAKSSRRLLIVVAVLVLAAVAPFVLSKDLRARYATIFGQDVKAGTEEAAVVQSAQESEQSRIELIEDSFILTARHPIFGVGMYQFGAAAADLAISKGKQAFWHPVHSFLLLVMTETGIPGVLLYTAALVYCLIAVVRMAKFTRRHEELQGAPEAAGALLYSFVGFLTCMAFSPSAYLYHFPLMAGLVTALYRSIRIPMAAERQFKPPIMRMPQPARLTTSADGVR